MRMPDYNLFMLGDFSSAAYSPSWRATPERNLGGSSLNTSLLSTVGTRAFGDEFVSNPYKALRGSWDPFSGFKSYADAAYIDAAAPESTWDSAGDGSFATSDTAAIAITTIADGVKASPMMLFLNVALGVSLSIKPWLDEAIARENEAAETGEEPQHPPIMPEVEAGVREGLRWFVREWLVKFTVKPRLEWLAIHSLEAEAATKLLCPLRQHVAELWTLSSLFGWPWYRRLGAFLEGALYSNFLLKAADVVYTAVHLGVYTARGAWRKEGPHPARWYARQLRDAVVRCTLTWALGAACAALFAMANEWPVKAGVGQFLGETATSMFLLPPLLSALQ